MSKTWIIDPSSIEENRGSFVYLVYYKATVEMKRGKDVRFLEDFTITQKDILDDICPDDDVFISLWSYPQIELCRLLYLRIPQAKFFGYSPLIMEERLPLYIMSREEIYQGIQHYAFYTDTFKHLLLSDCDGHLKDRPEVYPLCGIEYGCSRNCSFCPVTPNLPGKTKISIPLIDTIRSLENYQKKTPGSGVHFTDEDFFRDVKKAKFILEENQRLFEDKEYGPSVIALGSVNTFTDFLDSFNTDAEAFRFCKKVGLFLVEIGLETADHGLAAHMGKSKIDAAVRLAERVRQAPVKILWLTLSLSPGETIASLNATGDFLKEYGLNPKEMSPRIRTNGTRAGLGQFFQKYPGTRDYKSIEEKGMTLSTRPSRLIPGFIPHSLLKDRVKEVDNSRKEEYEYWLSLYGAPMMTFFEGGRVHQMIDILPYPRWQSIISVCVAGRLGIIR